MEMINQLLFKPKRVEVSRRDIPNPISPLTPEDRAGMLRNTFRDKAIGGAPYRYVPVNPALPNSSLVRKYQDFQMEAPKLSLPDILDSYKRY